MATIVPKIFPVDTQPRVAIGVSVPFSGPAVFNSTYQMILPAFGAFTGLHILIPKKEDKIYVTTGKEVIEIGEN